MSNDEPSCFTGKVCHLVYDHAQQATKKFRYRYKKSHRRNGLAPSPYRCDLCGYWHVGNSSDKQKKLWLTGRKVNFSLPSKLTHLMTPEEVREKIDRVTTETRDELLREFVQYCIDCAPAHIKYVAIEMASLFDKPLTTEKEK